MCLFGPKTIHNYLHVANIPFVEHKEWCTIMAYMMVYAILGKQSTTGLCDVAQRKVEVLLLALKLIIFV